MTEPGDARRYDLNQTTIKVGGREYSATTLLKAGATLVVVLAAVIMAVAVYAPIGLVAVAGGLFFLDLALRRRP